MPHDSGLVPAFIAEGQEGTVREAVRLAAQGRSQLEDFKAELVWLHEAAAAEHELFEVVDGVAVIPVCGVLLPYLPYAGSRWATGYNVLQLQLERAFDSSRVRGVALDIHSPGGLVLGFFELVEWIHEAKRQAGKPVAAIVNSIAASAAYGVASTADSIACPPLGLVGSIGVKMVHLEYSGMLKAAGITHTIIKSGDWKGAGNSLEPLPRKVLDDWQANADEYRGLLCEAIGFGRGQTSTGARFDAAAALATEAYQYERPSKIEEALSLGIIDAIARPDEAFNEFAEALAAS